MPGDDENNADDLDNRGGKPHLNHGCRQFPLLAGPGKCHEYRIGEKELATEQDENPGCVGVLEAMLEFRSLPLQFNRLRSIALRKMAELLWKI